MYDIKTNSLEEQWMPFTDNRGFKRDPRLIVNSEGVYVKGHLGEDVIDGSSGLFCSPAGHCHPKIIEAVHQVMQKLTYVSPFGTSQPLGFALAQKLTGLLPSEFNRIFFVNSGSEAIDTMMKTVMAYHYARGKQPNRFVSRERAYHGVNLGGLSLSGMINNRRQFPITIPNVVHLRHTWDSENELFELGQRNVGSDRAEDLQCAINTYGAETIAAVVIEPVAGSTGVLPPPKGYLERIREICTSNSILLVFDDVICGFGRLGGNFSEDVFGVKPDIITMAKALTNGSAPMGAVAYRQEIYDTILDAAPDGAIEHLFGASCVLCSGACCP